MHDNMRAELSQIFRAEGGKGAVLTNGTWAPTDNALISQYIAAGEPPKPQFPPPVPWGAPPVPKPKPVPKPAPGCGGCGGGKRS